MVGTSTSFVGSKRIRLRVVRGLRLCVGLLWLRLRVSQMLDIDSASVQSSLPSTFVFIPALYHINLQSALRMKTPRHPTIMDLDQPRHCNAGGLVYIGEFYIDFNPRNDGSINSVTKGARKLLQVLELCDHGVLKVYECKNLSRSCQWLSFKPRYDPMQQYFRASFSATSLQ